MRYPTAAAEHAYMKQRQEQNLARCITNGNENWALAHLKEIGVKWTRQAQWGYRLFDFWNSNLGIAVEIDGPEHNRRYDSVRDHYNTRPDDIRRLYPKTPKLFDQLI